MKISLITARLAAWLTNPALWRTIVLSGSLAIFGAGSLPAQVPAVPSWGIGPFMRPVGAEPVIGPRVASTFFCPMRNEEINWEVTATYNPAAIVRNGMIYVLYRAQDNQESTTSRLGLATSTNGTTFIRQSAPVFYPANDNQEVYEWYGGCEDPRVCQTTNGTYILTYTEYNLDNTLSNAVLARLAIATSTDLVNWTKQGPAFATALGGKYLNVKTKSASIVQQIVNGQPVVVAINGQYWMYWGEGSVSLATSTDLVNWTPVEDGKGNLVSLMSPRSGRFDSSLVEGGPLALLTTNGIVVLYNGKNGSSGGDTNIGPNAYSSGQALFSATNPTNLLSRTDTPFITPTLPWEQTNGQYGYGTTFSEGMAYLNGNWYLYYGADDEFVGVATTGIQLTYTPSLSANLALNRPVTVSSDDGVHFGPYAVDGNYATRWGSQYSDPQWIYVDLGVTYHITNVVLDWESAYATAFQVQVSADAISWTTIYSTTNSIGGVNNLTGLSGNGRYVRMYGTQRTTIGGVQYGYSLWEFEVYGNAAGGSPPATPTGLTATAGNTQVTLNWTNSLYVTSYNVKRSTTSGGSYTTIASPTATSYTDTGLTNGTTYSDAVSATNSLGESTNSAPVSATPQAPRSGAAFDINFDVPGSTAAITENQNNFGYNSVNYSGLGAASDSGTYWNPIVQNGTTSGDLLSDGTTSSPITFSDASTGVYGAQDYYDAYVPGTTTPLGLQAPYFFENNGSTATETLNNVPAGNFDLYLYGDNLTYNNRGATFTAFTSLTPATTQSTVGTGNGNANATFTEGVNYVEFTGLSLASPGTITFTYTANTAATNYVDPQNEGDFNGLQLVSVQTVSTTSTLLNFSINDGVIQFGWPADHIGWRLEAQTNVDDAGLNTNWSAISGSAVTNQMSISIGTANGSVFFRLVYP